VTTAHTELVRAQDIVVELRGSLNHEAGGDIATQLAALYDYCYRQLVAANVKKDPAPAREVLGILHDLGTAWQQIAAQQRQAQAASVNPASIARAV
jgi:flagellar protein FliS